MHAYLSFLWDSTLIRDELNSEHLLAHPKGYCTHA